MKKNPFNRYWNKTEVEAEILTIKDDPALPFILKYLSRGKVIEAGCGLGRYCFYLNELNYDVIGIDISKLAIKKCKRYAREHGYLGLEFVIADVRKLPFRNCSFSSYISLGVTEHFPEGPCEVLTEALRVLNLKGVIIITTPNTFSPWTVNRAYLVWKGHWGMGYECSYTCRSLANILKKCNFTILETRYIGLELSFEVFFGMTFSVLGRIVPPAERLLERCHKYFRKRLHLPDIPVLGVFGFSSLVVASKVST